MNALVQSELASAGPLAFGGCLAAGVLTGLSPCCLALVPVTVAYLGDDALRGDGEGEGSLVAPAILFTLGLATTLSVLGVTATLLGSGVAGFGLVLEKVLPLLAASLAVVMGLNLLELVELQFPSIGESLAIDRVPPALRSFLLGASTALIASPCSTPVLTAVLGFVATSGRPLLGGGLLFSYSLGYCAPVLAAGLASEKVVAASRQTGALQWVSPAIGALLVGVGTYSSLGVVFG